MKNSTSNPLSPSLLSGRGTMSVSSHKTVRMPTGVGTVQQGLLLIARLHIPQSLTSIFKATGAFSGQVGPLITMCFWMRTTLGKNHLSHYEVATDVVLPALMDCNLFHLHSVTSMHALHARSPFRLPYIVSNMNPPTRCFSDRILQMLTLSARVLKITTTHKALLTFPTLPLSSTLVKRQQPWRLTNVISDHCTKICQLSCISLEW